MDQRLPGDRPVCSFALPGLVHGNVPTRAFQASFSLLERAATLLAKGLLELDNRLKNAGENLVRYEVWRGPEYLQAYVDATKRYFGTKGQRDRFEKETRSLIAGIDSKETT